MDIDIQVDKQKLAMLVARLKETRRKLEPEAAKEIRRTAVPSMRADIKASAARRLPRRGGLAARAAATSRTTVISSRGMLRIRTNSRKFDVNRTDRGVVWHPVFGNRNNWVAQPITPGWWSIPVRANHDNIVKAADDAVNKITSRLV